MKKTMLRVLGVMQAGIFVSISMMGTTASAATDKQGMWLKGDYHTHTYLSDGSYSAAEVAQKAKQFGLDWYSATDHGGSSVGTRDQTGTKWADGTADLVKGVMPRWATISGVGEDEINKNRQSILEFSGFEWNVPTHEHASVGIVGNSAEAEKQLAIFDYEFDSTKEAWNNTNSLFTGIERSIDGKTEMKKDASGNMIANTEAKKLTNNTHAGALAGAKYLEEKFPTTSYFLVNHASRALSYTAADLKEFNDIAPDVAFGAELLPGHQASAFRGGLGYMTTYDSVLKKNVNIAGKTGTTLAEKLNSYILSLDAAQQPLYTDKIKADLLTSVTQNVPKQRTYGGADYMLAKVGGVWDTMLSEGRNFWIFGNSDFHIDTEKAKTQAGSEPDFWPGEYSKNYTYTYGKDYQSILDGMRSGNSFSVLGDLINALDYKITNNDTSATMGENLTPVQGKDTTVTIRFKSPDINNNGSKPVVDHIDLIAGEVKGETAVKYVDSSKVSITNFEDPKQYLTKEYQNDDVTATTSVVRRFDKSEFTVDKDGYMTVTFALPATEKNMYYRLRGTNNQLGTTNVDVNGNPTIDTSSEIVVGDNTVAKAYDDSWFYTNPIFVNAQVDGVTINGVLKDQSGKALADKNLEISSGNQVAKTDANGKFTFNNVAVGINTLYVKDASDNVESQMAFNLQRGQTTQFSQGDVWVADKVYSVNMEFTANGGNVTIQNVSTYSASPAAAAITATVTSAKTTNITASSTVNPKTSDDFNPVPVLLLAAVSGTIIGILAPKFKKLKEKQ